MRRLASALVSAALIASAWFCVVVVPVRADVSRATSAAAPDPSSVLAVVSSARGTLRLRGTSGVLALTGVPARPVWFSDHPERTAGTYSMAQFQDVFFRQQDPPNAALDVSGADPTRDVVILELSDPRYASSTRTLRFHVDVVADPATALGPSSQLRWQTARADPQVARSFGASALFVDSAAGDGTQPCLVPLQDGYIPNPSGISCLDAQTVVDMTNIPNDCYTNEQYFAIPDFGAWLCNGVAGQAVAWTAASDNFRFAGASFVMHPCSQDPPECKSQ
jgi:hypothetical protein